MEDHYELKGQNEYIGFIGIVDFLTQQGIDNSDIRTTLDSTIVNQSDIVSDFINNTEIDNYLQDNGYITDQTVLNFGFTNILEFYNEKKRLESLGVNWSNPDDKRKLLSSYFDSYKAINTLANQQHTGSKVTSTSKELIQNAIDATVQALNPNIDPIGKFGMGAKTMLGLLTKKGEYILYNCNVKGVNKQLLIYQSSDKLQDIIISDQTDFIASKIPNFKPKQSKGSQVTIHLESNNDQETITNAVEAFQYNPNVNILSVVNDKYANLYEQPKNTEGFVFIEASDGDINITDEGDGFDPIKVFSTSTKNSSERNLIEFKQDSKAFIDPNSKRAITMLLQDTVLTYEDIPKEQLELYNPETLTTGIVMDNKSYLGTSETRSNWLINENSIASLEFSIANLIDSSDNQAPIINTIYLWVSNQDKAKKSQLQPIINLLRTKVESLISDPSITTLPNTQEFAQFQTRTDKITFLHPDLIQQYNPSTIEGSYVYDTTDGYNIWSVPMSNRINDVENKLSNYNIEDLLEINDGKRLEQLGLLRVFKIDNIQVPQIWIDDELITILNETEQEISANLNDQELIEKYNRLIWLINSHLNPIRTGYKNDQFPIQYLPTFYTKEKEKIQKAQLEASLRANKQVAELQDKYQIQSQKSLQYITQHLSKPLINQESQTPILIYPRIEKYSYGDVKSAKFENNDYSIEFNIEDFGSKQIIVRIRLKNQKKLLYLEINETHLETIIQPKYDLSGYEEIPNPNPDISGLYYSTLEDLINSGRPLNFACLDSLTKNLHNNASFEQLSNLFTELQKIEPDSNNPAEDVENINKDKRKPKENVFSPADLEIIKDTALISKIVDSTIVIENKDFFIKFVKSGIKIRVNIEFASGEIKYAEIEKNENKFQDFLNLFNEVDITNNYIEFNLERFNQLKQLNDDDNNAVYSYLSEVLLNSNTVYTKDVFNESNLASNLGQFNPARIENGLSTVRISNREFYITISPRPSSTDNEIEYELFFKLYDAENEMKFVIKQSDTDKFETVQYLFNELLLHPSGYSSQELTNIIQSKIPYIHTPTFLTDDFVYFASSKDEILEYITDLFDANIQIFSPTPRISETISYEMIENTPYRVNIQDLGGGYRIMSSAFSLIIENNGQVYLSNGFKTVNFEKPGLYKTLQNNYQLDTDSILNFTMNQEIFEIFASPDNNITDEYIEILESMSFDNMLTLDESKNSFRYITYEYNMGVDTFRIDFNDKSFTFYITENIEVTCYNEPNNFTFTIDKSEINPDSLKAFLDTREFKSIIISDEDFQGINNVKLDHNIQDIFKRILLTNIELSNNPDQFKTNLDSDQNQDLQETDNQFNPEKVRIFNPQQLELTKNIAKIRSSNILTEVICKDFDIYIHKKNEHYSLSIRIANQTYSLIVTPESIKNYELLNRFCDPQNTDKCIEVTQEMIELIISEDANNIVTALRFMNISESLYTLSDLTEPEMIEYSPIDIEINSDNIELDHPNYKINIRLTANNEYSITYTLYNGVNYECKISPDNIEYFPIINYLYNDLRTTSDDKQLIKSLHSPFYVTEQLQESRNEIDFLQVTKTLFELNIQLNSKPPEFSESITIEQIQQHPYSVTMFQKKNNEIKIFSDSFKVSINDSGEVLVDNNNGNFFFSDQNIYQQLMNNFDLNNAQQPVIATDINDELYQFFNSIDQDDPNTDILADISYAPDYDSSSRSVEDSDNFQYIYYDNYRDKTFRFTLPNHYWNIDINDDSDKFEIGLSSYNSGNLNVGFFTITSDELDPQLLKQFLINKDFNSLIIPSDEFEELTTQRTKAQQKQTFLRILKTNIELSQNPSRFSSKEKEKIDSPTTPNLQTIEHDPKALEESISNLAYMETLYNQLTQSPQRSDDLLLSVLKSESVEGFQKIKDQLDKAFEMIGSIFDGNTSQGLDTYVSEQTRIFNNIKTYSLAHFANGKTLEKNSIIVKNIKQAIAKIDMVLDDDNLNNNDKGKQIMMILLNPERITKNNISQATDLYLPITNNKLYTAQIQAYLTGPQLGEDDSMLVVLDNLKKINKTNPDLAKQLSDILFRRDQQDDNSDKQYSIFEQSILGMKIDAANQYILRFLSIPDAVLLERNILKDQQLPTNTSVELKKDTSIGEVAFAGITTNNASDLQPDTLKFQGINQKRQDRISAINVEHSRLATSQSTSDNYYTVMRELFQNSKDASYKKEGKTTISLNQELVTNQTKSDLDLDPQSEYLHTQFHDNATGVPSFLLNYFNPFKSTKDKGDLQSAGAFGCGAITINSIADKYEIVTREEGQELGTRVVVEVIKEGDQVVGTKVLKLESVENAEVGFKIDMYSKVQGSMIPELKALITSSSLIDVSDLERASNPNLELKINSETQEPNPNLKKVYQSDTVELIQGAKSGFWVKNIYISELNHTQNQFEQPLPSFVSKILKSEDLSVNFKDKLELVRTRNGFSQTGEREAMIKLYSSVLQYSSSKLFNGDNITIPGLDENLAKAYTKYFNPELETLAINLQQGKEVDLAYLNTLSQSQWVSVMLYTPFENEGTTSSLMQYFETLDILRQQTLNEQMNDPSHRGEKINEALKTLSPEQRKRYDKLQSSPLQAMYSAINTSNFFDLNLSSKERAESETILTDEMIEAKYNSPSQIRNRQSFEEMFEILTENLPTPGNPPVKFKLQWVERNGGTDYSGSLINGVILCKYNINKIDNFLSKPLKDNYNDSIYNVIVHEIAHSLEELAGRFVTHYNNPAVTHDLVFKEMMRLNFARLLAKFNQRIVVYLRPLLLDPTLTCTKF